MHESIQACRFHICDPFHDTVSNRLQIKMIDHVVHCILLLYASLYTK